MGAHKGARGRSLIGRGGLLIPIINNVVYRSGITVGDHLEGTGGGGLDRHPLCHSAVFPLQSGSYYRERNSERGLQGCNYSCQQMCTLWSDHHPAPHQLFFFLPPPNGLIGPVIALILLRFPLSSAAESVGEAQMEVMGVGGRGGLHC